MPLLLHVCIIFDLIINISSNYILNPFLCSTCCNKFSLWRKTDKGKIDVMLYYGIIMGGITIYIVPLIGLGVEHSNESGETNPKIKIIFFNHLNRNNKQKLLQNSAI